ncbi:MAG: NRDE family protein [Rhodoferax sp.]|nr:NRDE family protein [Rhodoferax sp.]
MCLIAWNWRPDHPQRLLLIANRDETLVRAAQPLHWWANGDILAGRDLQAGGAWLGVSRTGRLAALTNFRSATKPRADAPSRGQLIPAFLQSGLSAADFLHTLSGQIDRYNPFNLLVFDGQQLLGLESRQHRIVPLAPGVAAVSNADFHTPWPKLVRWREQLTQLSQGQRTSDADLLPLLQDTALAPDPQLPTTGVAIELERALSAAFVALPHYGTRASSVVRIGTDQHSFLELTYRTATPALAQAQRVVWSDAGATQGE